MNEAYRSSLAAAWEYVREHGDELDRARIAALSGENVEGAPVATRQPQNADGGWPAYWSEGATSLDGTCYQLFLLRDLPAEAVAVNVPAALAYLAAAQADDGTWQEAPGAGAPEWLLPGTPSARVYLTASCAATLADYDVAPEAVAKAAAAIEWSVDPHGRVPAPTVAHWLAARVLRTQGRTMLVRRILDVVGRSFETFGAEDLAWFGASTRAGDRWNRRIAQRLTVVQNEDGSWTDGSHEQHSATLTVTAARVLLAAQGAAADDKSEDEPEQH